MKSRAGAERGRSGSRGRQGKSCDYRVIPVFSGADAPAFPLSVLAERDRVDLSRAKRKKQRGPAEDDRGGAAGNAQRRKANPE
jgi:hypothetical protein